MCKEINEHSDVFIKNRFDYLSSIIGILSRNWVKVGMEYWNVYAIAGFINDISYFYFAPTS